jgi:hypothetical protein
LQSALGFPCLVRVSLMEPMQTFLGWHQWQNQHLTYPTSLKTPRLTRHAMTQESLQTLWPLQHLFPSWPASHLCKTSLYNGQPASMYPFEARRPHGHFTRTLSSQAVSSQQNIGPIGLKKYCPRSPTKMNSTSKVRNRQPLYEIIFFPHSHCRWD